MDKYIIVGTPNSGKTTIFNALTGQKEKVGNWHGVTATYKKGSYKSKKTTFEVLDLPGIYSLSPYSCEESVSVDIIFKKEYNAIIFVLDASCPQGGLSLLKELLKLNKKIILVLNKCQKVDVQKKFNNLENYFKIDPYNKKNIINLAENLLNFNGVEKEITLKEDVISTNKFYDKYLLNPLILFPIYIVIVGICFLIAFGKVGTILSRVLQNGITEISKRAEYVFIKNSFLSVVISKTILNLQGVISLLPQIIIMQLFLIVLEESGLSARLCVVTYNILSKIGLSGKSVFPIISALGCTAVTAKLCNSCENKNVKCNTLCFLPFVPCMAKNSALIFLCKTFFKNYVLAYVLLYLSLIFSGIIFLWLKEKFKKTIKENMVIELVELSLPKFKIVVKNLFGSVIDFFKKIISSCIIVSLFLAIFTSITPKLSLTYNLQDSILCFVCKKTEKLFIPFGLGNWKLIISLVVGFFAKEGVISAISGLYVDYFSLTMSTKVCFLIVFMLYPPCVTSLISISKQASKLAKKILLFQLGYALFASLIVNILLTNFYLFCIITILAVGVTFIYGRIYRKRKQKTNKIFTSTRGGVFCHFKGFKKKRYKD